MRGDNDLEKCVICHKLTSVKTTEDIDKRYGYVHGVGQLCIDCYTARSTQEIQASAFSRLQEYEKCVVCRSQTKVLKSVAVNERSCYVEGLGQLCQDCYKNVV